MTHVSFRQGAFATTVFLACMLILTSVAFADSRSNRERRTIVLTNVLAKLLEQVPPQASSPEAVAAALTNTGGNSSSGGSSSNGNNGGAQGGNGGNGGNSSPGGLVKAGSVVSNSTAVNAINTVIIRIGRGL